MSTLFFCGGFKLALFFSSALQKIVPAVYMTTLMGCDDNYAGSAHNADGDELMARLLYFQQ